MGAQEMMHEQHLNQMAEYVAEDGTVETVKVKVPVVTHNDVSWRELDVPKLVLCPPAALKIKGMKVKFKARLGGLGEEKAEKGELQMHVGGGAFSRSTMATIEIEFEGTEPPEGLMKINDELLKIIN
jgi:hypothetical protein